MNNKTYQKWAQTKDREDEGYNRHTQTLTASKARLIHGALGLAGESGEVVDIIKKHVQYNKDLNIAHLKEELGDVLFYISLILTDINSSFEEVFLQNQEKLNKRFPNGFTEINASKRADKNE